MGPVTKRRLTKIKGVARKSPYPQRRTQHGKYESTSSNKVNIGDWIGDMNQELAIQDESTTRNAKDMDGTHGPVEDNMRWRSNLAFAGDGSSK
ncbi:hypothetical protein V6N13_043345 [Hibiscus sabdariffa]|uniref:Uncharacterized protein n=2 Tax=Hibiscus sabdariffa TaxID=183260 RepID=A0ABR2G2Y2_9ROSI